MTNIIVSPQISKVIVIEESAPKIIVVNSGINGIGITDLELELQYIANYESFYTALTYDVNNKLTEVNIYQDDTLATHLFSKEFTYDLGGNCTVVVITRIDTGEILTKTMEYNLSGYLINSTRVIS